MATDTNLEPWEIEIASLREQLAQAERERDKWHEDCVHYEHAAESYETQYANEFAKRSELAEAFQKLGADYRGAVARAEAAEAQVRELVACCSHETPCDCSHCPEHGSDEWVHVARAALEAHKEAAGG